VIAASLMALAVWLGFSKPIPKEIKVKKSLSAKQLSYFLAVIIIIFLPTMTGVIFSLLTVLFLPKVIAALPAKSTQQQHRAIAQELDLAIDLLAAA